MKRLELIGLRLPKIREGDDIPGLIIESSLEVGIELKDYDIITITTKILSKSLGSLYNMNEVKPSSKAKKLARKAGGDPRFIEILLRESDEIIAAIPIKKLVEEGIVKPETLSKNKENLLKVLNNFPTLFLTRRDEQLWTDSGLDSSNHPPGIVSVPPRNLDDHAKRISDEIMSRTGIRVGVVLCDTEMLPGGPLDIARGAYGVPVTLQKFGEPDAYGKPKFGGSDNIANAVCAAAGLLFGQHGGWTPVVVVKGLEYEWSTFGMKWLAKSTNSEEAVRESIRHTIRVLGLSHVIKILFRRRPS